jgi:3-hydroxyisobutyrate dehydrogenase-like beta-hydroxyacid dehydrogenase
VVAASIALWAEVIAYARRAGLDPDLLVDALAGGWADSEIRRVHGHDLAAGRFRRTPGFILLKDLDIIDDVARTTHAPMPLTAAATMLYRLLLAQGRPPGGPGALMQLYEEAAPS